MQIDAFMYNPKADLVSTRQKAVKRRSMNYELPGMEVRWFYEDVDCFFEINNYNWVLYEKFLGFI